MSELWLFLRGAKPKEEDQLNAGCWMLVFLTVLLVYLIWKFI